MSSLLGRVLWIVSSSLVVANPIIAQASSDYAFFHENVMGTSLELRVKASSTAAANQAEAVILREIDRLSAVFSEYEANSEFRLWQDRPAEAKMVSKELFELLQASDDWRIRSHGAFDPRVQILTKLWTQAAAQDRFPSDAEIAKSLSELNRPAWKLDAHARTAERLPGAPLSLNAIAKGYIVEQACHRALDPAHGILGLLLNVGGDLRVCGEMAGRVDIVDPNANSADPLVTVEVSNRAVATSGRAQRGFRIQGQWYSHIFDPRTGRPADQTAGATVIAPKSSDADALATILNVLPPAEGVRLIETLDDIQCMIVARDGKITKSRGWARHEVVLNVLPSPKSLGPQPTAAQDKPWDENHELAIDFEINNPDSNNRRYRRPYVALWVEDLNGKPVRTITLWLSQGGAGPDRWLPDMKKWYDVNAKVKKESKIDLVHTIARSTKQPGKYSVVWDGKDDNGKPVAAGEYVLFLEAAREHGTYQIIRKNVTLTGKPFDEELKGNVEIKSASLAYRRKAAAKKP